MQVILGWVLRQEGDLDGARSPFEAGLRISRRNRTGSGLANASLGLACLNADQGNWHRPGELHGAAQAVLDQTAHPGRTARRVTAKTALTRSGPDHIRRVGARSP